MTEIETMRSEEQSKAGPPSRKVWWVILAFGLGLGLLIALNMK
jgi:hypothetical protein